jgi:hypothetical protein
MASASGGPGEQARDDGGRHQDQEVPADREGPPPGERGDRQPHQPVVDGEQDPRRQDARQLGPVVLQVGHRVLLEHQDAPVQDEQRDQGHQQPRPDRGQHAARQVLPPADGGGK